MAWKITKKDIPLISLGARMLACGGGGETKTVEALLMSLMTEDSSIEVRSIDEVNEEWVVPIAVMGSPVIYSEHIPTGEEGNITLRRYEQHTQHRAGALISIEIGGMNALTPLVVALQTGLPVVDGDGMGRAFPELFMTTFYLNRLPLTPLILEAPFADMTIQTGTAEEVAQEAKAFILKHGGYAHIACYGARGFHIKTAMIPGTLKLVHCLGTVLNENEQKDKDIILKKITEVFENSVYGRPLVILEGFITEVVRWFEQSQLVGQFTISGAKAYSGQTFRISFKNEFIAIKDLNGYVCTVPDLILLLDFETCMPLGVSDVQEGRHILLLVIPAPTILRTTDMLQYVGPRQFGLENVHYRAIELWRGEVLDETRD